VVQKTVRALIRFEQSVEALPESGIVTADSVQIAGPLFRRQLQGGVK